MWFCKRQSGQYIITCDSPPWVFTSSSCPHLFALWVICSCFNLSISIFMLFFQTRVMWLLFIHLVVLFCDVLLASMFSLILLLSSSPNLSLFSFSLGLLRITRQDCVTGRETKKVVAMTNMGWPKFSKVLLPGGLIGSCTKKLLRQTTPHLTFSFVMQTSNASKKQIWLIEFSQWTPDPGQEDLVATQVQQSLRCPQMWRCQQSLRCQQNLRCQQH